MTNFKLLLAVQITFVTCSSIGPGKLLLFVKKISFTKLVVLFKEPLVGSSKDAAGTPIQKEGLKNVDDKQSTLLLVHLYTLILYDLNIRRR